MEPTDWMTAYALMEVLDRWLKPQDVKVGQIGSEGAEKGGGNVEYTKAGETIRINVRLQDAATGRILTRAGYHVLTASGGEQAIHLAQTHPGPIDLLTAQEDGATCPTCAQPIDAKAIGTICQSLEAQLARQDGQLRAHGQGPQRG